MRYKITHKTTYRYSAVVSRSKHVVHMSPRVLPGHKILLHDLDIAPMPGDRKDLFDYFGNSVSLLSIDESHKHLSIVATSMIDVQREVVQEPAHSVPWEVVRDLMREPVRSVEAEYSCYSYFTRPFRSIRDYAEPSFAPGRPILEAVADLTGRIHQDFEYDQTVTDVTTPVGEVFELKSGVCQDFAHLELSCLRAMGLPARYVSGYLRTYPPKGQPRLIGVDASHAWISVWCPDNDWVDFDPTNNKLVSDEHIAIACGRDFVDVSPASGVILGGGDHFVEVSVDVMPLDN